MVTLNIAKRKEIVASNRCQEVLATLFLPTFIFMTNHNQIIEKHRCNESLTNAEVVKCSYEENKKDIQFMLVKVGMMVNNLYN